MMSTLTRCKKARMSWFGLPSMTSSDSGVVSNTSAFPAGNRFTSPVHCPGVGPGALDDRFQAAAQVLCQGACRHHIQDGLSTARGDQPFEAGASTASVLPLPVAACKIRSWPWRMGG